MKVKGNNVLTELGIINVFKLYHPLNISGSIIFVPLSISYLNGKYLLLFHSFSHSKNITFLNNKKKHLFQYKLHFLE